MSRSSLLLIAKSLESLALSLWLGGLAVTGALVAPVAFGALDRSQAGRVVGECFRRLNWVGVVCGVILLGALLLESRGGRDAGNGLRRVRALLVTAGVAMSLYLAVVLFPRLDALRVNGGAPASENVAVFDRLHHRYERLGSLQVLILLGVLLGSAVATRNAPGSRLPAPGSGGLTSPPFPPPRDGEGGLEPRRGARSQEPAR